MLAQTRVDNSHSARGLRGRLLGAGGDSVVNVLIYNLVDPDPVVKSIVGLGEIEPLALWRDGATSRVSRRRTLSLFELVPNAGTTTIHEARARPC